MTAPEIRLRGLTFSYRPGSGAVPALRDVSLDVPPGSRLALVGPVGSGKSTLVHLLARVYPAPSAAIFVGETDLNEIPVEIHRRSVALVAQDPFLFSRTLRENLALARPGATEDEILRAVRAAGLEDDLDSLPEGLDTQIGERGVTLSGGQRQRATIARALLADAPVLILDDALSSVDADTERRILSGLEEAARARTLLIVTHRPSTLAAVDRIAVPMGTAKAVLLHRASIARVHAVLIFILVSFHCTSLLARVTGTRAFIVGFVVSLLPSRFTGGASRRSELLIGERVETLRSQEKRRASTPTV